MTAISDSAIARPITDAPSASSPAHAGRTTDGSRPWRLPAVLGGLALAAAPLTMTIGVFTSPPQDSTSHVDYVESMARAPFQAILSANFLHYTWLLLVLGVVALIPLFRSRRGRGFGLTMAVLSIVTSMQISGLLLSDFYAVRGSAESGVQAAANIEFDLGTTADIWLWTGKISVLFVPLLFCALAYSRLISWWLIPVFIVATVVSFLPISVAIAAPAMIISWAPAFAVAWQLVSGRVRNP